MFCSSTSSFIPLLLIVIGPPEPSLSDRAVPAWSTDPSPSDSSMPDDNCYWSILHCITDSWIPDHLAIKPCTYVILSVYCTSALSQIMPLLILIGPPIPLPFGCIDFYLMLIVIHTCTLYITIVLAGTIFGLNPSYLEDPFLDSSNGFLHKLLSIIQITNKI